LYKKGGGNNEKKKKRKKENNHQHAEILGDWKACDIFQGSVNVIKREEKKKKRPACRNSERLESLWPLVRIYKCNKKGGKKEKRKNETKTCVPK